MFEQVGDGTERAGGDVGTGEGATFTRKTLDAMLDCALGGIAQLAAIQAAALAEPYPGELPA